ncbi:unnamed protein product [Effrenium voratum]|uniref:Spondin-like TSP1 domain-containing protein n=1 Tax=Effrenium voratum TaxID=2562239 RepID=A0AA36JE75_9DINO|nr:unnamed protein product [Effrenium voratum]
MRRLRHVGAAGLGEKVLQCPLAKQIEQPLPDLTPYLQKSSLCEWARRSIAEHPLQMSRRWPTPSLPKLPWDERIAEGRSSNSSSLLRRLEDDESKSPDDGNWGTWYVAAAFVQPNKVMAGSVPKLGQLELLGGEELGQVSHMAMTHSDGGTAEMFLASMTNAQSETVIRYKYALLEGKITLSSAAVVWPAEDAKRRVARLAAGGGGAAGAALYVADDEGHVSVLSAAALRSGARMDGVQLHETKLQGEAREPITGLALLANGTLIWSTPSSVSSSLTDGSHVSELLSETQLQKMAASAKIVALAATSSHLFLAVHRGRTTQSCTVYRTDLAGKSPVALSYQWPAEQMWLGLAGFDLWAAVPLGIYALPVEFQESTVPRLELHIKGGNLASLHTFYIRGTDCALGNWTKVGKCSKTCGGGKQRFERSVLTPAVGGRPCPALRERQEDCFDQPCPEEATDCLMGQWIDEAPCSASCGYGQVRQRRTVLREAAFGGAACPEGRTRSVDCIITECGGYDFLLAAMPGKGLFSAQVLGLDQDLEWTASSVPRKPVANARKPSSEPPAFSGKPVPGARDAHHGIEICTTTSLGFGLRPTEVSWPGSLPVSDREMLMTVDSENRLLYLAPAGGSEITCWAYSVGEGHLVSFFSKHRVLDLDASSPERIVGMKLHVGSLFFGTAQGRILRIDEDALLSSGKNTPAVQELYKDVGKNLGPLQSLSAAGTYLLWATPSQVTLGSIDGPQSAVSPRPLLVEKSLEDLAGSLVEVIQAELTADGSSFFLAAWDTDQATLSIFQVAISMESASNSMVEHQQLRQLRQSWTHQDVRLLLTPFAAFVHSHEKIWTFPTSITQETTPALIYPEPGAEANASVTGVGHFFQKGLDCQVSAWLNMSSCTATCGGGILRQAREVLAEASEGGLSCPDLERELPCREQLCPVDCQMSRWKDLGTCSRSCGGGTVRQTRIVESHPMYGGAPCSKVLERRVTCNSEPCQGLDCMLSDWIDKGLCSRACGGGHQEQYRKVVRQPAFGGLPCSKNMTRVVMCNIVPCKVEGFDPIAAGHSTGFDFDIRDYCDPQEAC